jgi:hypothetical protein
VLPFTNAINSLDGDFCWLNDRWAYPRILGRRHDLLFGSPAQWCRRLCGIVARVACVKITTGAEGEVKIRIGAF